MRRFLRPFGIVWVLVLAAACGTSSVPLGGDVIARVDDTVISSEVVKRAAQEGQVSKEESVERLLGDAIGAQEALRAHLDERPDVRGRLRAVLARGVVERVQANARAEGPPNDQEVDALTQEAWFEVDRPEMRSSVHAVVMFGKKDDRKDPAVRTPRKELAETIRTLVLTAKTPDELIALASAKSDGKLEVRAEKLDPVTADARLANGSSFDPDFVKGLFAIGKVGDTSVVVESASGFHVIRLVEILPERHLPIEERRRRFAEEIYARRVRKALDEHLTLLTKTQTVTVSPAASNILAEVPWQR